MSSEIIEAVHSAHKRWGYHWEHRFKLAEKLAEIMPLSSYLDLVEVSGTEAVESAVHLALCYTKRRHIVSFIQHFMERTGNQDDQWILVITIYMEAWADY